MNNFQIIIIQNIQKKCKNYHYWIKIFSSVFDFHSSIFIFCILKLFKILNNKDIFFILLSCIFIFLIKKILKVKRPYIQYQEKIKNNSNQIFNDYSCPSGHSFISILLILILMKKKKLKIKLILIIPLLVGFSRIYLGVHYLSDVLIGFILAYILNFIYNNYYN